MQSHKFIVINLENIETTEINDGDCTNDKEIDNLNFDLNLELEDHNTENILQHTIYNLEVCLRPSLKKLNNCLNCSGIRIMKKRFH